MSFRYMVAAMAILLTASSLCADVIPSRYADPDAARDRHAVAARLQDLGVPAGQAADRTRTLSDSCARYFAEAPDRIQLAGRDDEAGIGDGEKFWLGTLGLLGVLVAGAALAANH
jgi:hypothetical protein